MPNKIIVVLGMHRSGTSAVTRGLQVMGVSLGDTLYGALEGINEKGFWEDKDLNELNIEMLKALGSDWHHLTAIQRSDVEILLDKGYFLRAVKLLRQKISSSESIFAFKDPRVAKLLPFWKDVFSHCQLDVSYILVIRHPLSVVKSLAKRDGFDAERSHLLWLGHVIMSLTGSVDDKRVVVDYDCLMQSPENELARIAKLTNMKIDPTELQSYKSKFLDPKLRHTIYELNDLLLDNACPPLIQDIYAALLDVVSDKIQIDDQKLQNKIVRWSAEFERLKSPLLLIDKTTKTVAERDGKIASIREVVAERDRLISHLSESLSEAIAERDGQIASLSEAIAERDGQIASLSEAIAERDGQIASLHASLTEIRESTSWRITAPLRSVISFFK